MPPSILASTAAGPRRQNPVKQAIPQLGRLAKTRHLLAWGVKPISLTT